MPVAIGLPRLAAMLDDSGQAYAGGKPLPRRFGVWAFANGVHLDRWVPKQTGAQLGAVRRALARWPPSRSTSRW